MIQVAAHLLITPTREYLVDSLGLRMQYGNRTSHAQPPLVSTGGTGFIQCIIESASESLPHHCR
jgi:hypothetical protein